MLPAAVVRSETPGRTRLGIPTHDAHWYAHADTTLRRCPLVEELEVNPLAGSLLIRHHGPWRDIADYAQAQELFDVRATETKPVLKDRSNRPRTHHIDFKRALAEVGAITLFGLAVLQVKRGKFLPAGLPMVFQGLSLLREPMHVAPLLEHEDPDVPAEATVLS